MAYEVQVLKMGRCEVAGPEVYWMSHWNEWHLQPLYEPEVIVRFRR